MERWVAGRDSTESLIDYLLHLDPIDGEKPLICIDYFDTVITRTVNPEYTKEIASELLAQLLGGALSGSELYQHRRTLEREIVEQNAAAGELEFSFPVFSRYLYAKLAASCPQLELGALEDFVQSMLDIEVAVERSVQRVCPQILQVLSALKNAAFRIALVSDFYLPESCFRKFLDAHGLGNAFDHLYVSMDHGVSKGSGKLYQLISQECNYATANMLMIGDNEHADIKMAVENGLQTLLVSRPEQRKFYADFRKKLDLGGNSSTELFSRPKPTGDFGRMASSFWLFCHRLFKELSRKKVTNVFFLSKEGEFLKRLFESYQTDTYGGVRIRSHYLIASRKATFLPSLGPLETEDFLRLLAHYRDISIGDFLRSLNFGEQLVERLCSRLSDDCERVIVDLKGSDLFQELLDLDLFRRNYEERRLQQRKNFCNYLASFDVDTEEEGLCLVDVGWKGSIQDNIYYILEEKTAVQGYFIGSFHPTELKDKNRKKGLLFDNHKGQSSFFRVYNNNRSLFEMLLGASHGSADRYLTQKQFESEAQPAHLYVHSRVPSADAEILVLVLDLPEERTLYNSVINPLQEQIFHQFELLNNAYLQAGAISPDPRWFAQNHAKMVFTPTAAELELFAKLYHLENFGIFAYTNFQCEEQLSIRDRLGNFRQLLRNPEMLESGIWPPIILRRLGLGFLGGLDGKRRYHLEFTTFS